MTESTCQFCDGDGYTERFNDEQTGVVIEPCDACAATGVVNAGIPLEDSTAGGAE